MKKLRILAKYLFIAVFCGVIGLSFLVYNLFSTRFSTDKHENRLRTQLPQTLQSDPRQLPQTLNLFMEEFPHRPQLVGGILAEECQAVLSDFFRALRRRKTAPTAAPELTGAPMEGADD